MDARREAELEFHKWRHSVPMEILTELGELYRDADAIAARVREIGHTLTRTHQGHRPIVIG